MGNLLETLESLMGSEAKPLYGRIEPFADSHEGSPYEIGVIIDAQEKGRQSRLIECFGPSGLEFFLISGRHFNGSMRHAWSDLARPLQLVCLWVKKEKDLSIIEEGVVIERFEGLRSSYSAISAAQKMRIVIKKIARQGMSCEPLFQTFYAHLHLLHRHFPALRVLASFFTKALLAEGYLDPELMPSCHHCGAEKSQLWLSKGEWSCVMHKFQGAPWSLAQQQSLLELAQSKRVAPLEEEGDGELVELLSDWIDSL